MLLVRVANWRMLATRDAKGFATFKTNVGKTHEQIAALEKAELPAELAELARSGQDRRRQICRGIREDRSQSRCWAIETLLQGVTPVIVAAIEKMGSVKVSIGEAFAKTTADTEDRIGATITLQETVAGVAVLFGLADRVPDRARHHSSAGGPDRRA